MRTKWSRITRLTRRDWLKFVSAGCALVATFQAEYTLAMAAHFPAWIAWTVPGALDAYALRALQSGREVFTAVLAMVAVNAASHLVTAGILPMDWKLVTAVSAIAPLVLWRVHALRTPNEARLDVVHDVPAGTSTLISRAREAGMACLCPWETSSTLRACKGCEHGPHLAGACTGTEHTPEHAPVHDSSTDADAGAEAVHDPDTVTLTGTEHDPVHGSSTGTVRVPGPGHGEPFTPAVPDTVPAHWSDPDACPCLFSSTHTNECAGCDHVGHKEGACRSRLPVLEPEHGDENEHEHTDRAPVIPLQTPSTLPSTRDEHVHTSTPEGLTPDDVPALETLREHMTEHGLEHVPAMREVKTICRVGTPKARRVHKAMLREHTSTEGGAN